MLAEWLYQFESEIIFINHSEKELNISIFQGFDHAPTRLEQISQIGDTWINSIQISSSSDYDHEQARRDMKAAGLIWTYFDSGALQRTYKNTQQCAYPSSNLEIPYPGGVFNNVSGLFDTLTDDGNTKAVYSDRGERRIISDNS